MLFLYIPPKHSFLHKLFAHLVVHICLLLLVKMTIIIITECVRLKGFTSRHYRVAEVKKSHESKRPHTFQDLSSRVRFFISVASFFVSMHVYPMFPYNIKRSRPQLLKSIGSKRRQKVLFLKKNCYYHIYDGFQNSKLKSVDCDKEQLVH